MPCTAGLRPHPSTLPLPPATDEPPGPSRPPFHQALRLVTRTPPHLGILCRPVLPGSVPALPTLAHVRLPRVAIRPARPQTAPAQAGTGRDIVAGRAAGSCTAQTSPRDFVPLHKTGLEASARQTTGVNTLAPGLDAGPPRPVGTCPRRGRCRRPHQQLPLFAAVPFPCSGGLQGPAV